MRKPIGPRRREHALLLDGECMPRPIRCQAQAGRLTLNAFCGAFRFVRPDVAVLLVDMPPLPFSQPSTSRETWWIRLLPDFGKGRGMGWAAP